MDALQALTSAGLTLTTDGERLLVAPRERITPNLRTLIRQHKAELLANAAAHQAAAAAAQHSQAGNPLLSREQADRAHWPAWDGSEIDRTIGRVHLFMRHGIGADHAEHLAERLLLRDREHDDRSTCAECRHGRSTRCPDGAPLPAAALHRCARFAP